LHSESTCIRSNLSYLPPFLLDHLSSLIITPFLSKISILVNFIFLNSNLILFNFISINFILFSQIFLFRHQIMNSTQTSSLKQTKSWLIEHSDELKMTAARKFNVNVKTLTASIRRENLNKKANEGHNRILSNQKEMTIENYIRSLLIHEISSTHQVVFDAIKSLKRTRGFTCSIRRWFRAWWKRSNLHKIKTKSLSTIRFEAARESNVVRWFVDYKKILKTLNIRKRRNILNFDEAEFRIECMKKHEILISSDIKEHYVVSS
jgi:hypothetical protein